MTLGKFIPTDRSSLFKTQQRLSLKKLEANIGQYASTQSNVSAKVFVGRLTEGELHHRCIMEPFLVQKKKKKNNHRLIMPAKILDFCFNLFQFLLVIWLTIS
jgi:hypothetical protein